MKRKMILRGILGFPIGLEIGYLITIGISLCLADGYYSPCEPQLIARMGNEINAVVFQSALCGLLGVSFAASSVIWEIERWGIVKQTGIFFVINSLVMMPVAYVLYWMEHSVKGFLSYFGIFAIIFAVIWGIEMVAAKRNVKDMNTGLHRIRNDGDGEG